jgi:hypothetical protein
MPGMLGYRAVIRDGYPVVQMVLSDFGAVLPGLARRSLYLGYDAGDKHAFRLRSDLSSYCLALLTTFTLAFIGARQEHCWHPQP